MAGKRRHPAERAIIYAGVLGGLSNDRIDELLAHVGARSLDPKSFRSILSDYVSHFKRDPKKLGEAIEHPPTWSDLSDDDDR